MFGLRYLPNVATLKLDADKCTGCGMCVEVCPHAVFSIEQRKAAVTDFNACMECGACARNCPAGALFVKAGVGCAAAVLTGGAATKEPTCSCSEPAVNECFPTEKP